MLISDLKMSDLNRVVLVGRLVRDPEIRATQKGVPVCRFTLASNRYVGREESEKKEEVGFFDCVAYGRLGELISRHVTKGRRLGIDGSLRYDSWVQADGQKRTKIQIVVDNFMFLDSQPESLVSEASPVSEPGDLPKILAQPGNNETYEHNPQNVLEKNNDIPF